MRQGREEDGAGPLVKAEGLGHVYKTASSQVVALQGLDLELQSAETIAVVGPSGSGKTTLINILAALQRPSHGRVRVAGRDLTTITEPEREDYRRSVVGYLWQQSEKGLWPGLSALDNVQVPMLAEPGSRSERRDRALELLDRLSIGTVVVTHDPQLERYVDRVVRIRDTHASNLPLGSVGIPQPSLRALRQEAGGA